MDRTFSVAITSSFGLPLVVVFIEEDLVPRFLGPSFPRVPIDHSVGVFGTQLLLHRFLFLFPFWLFASVLLVFSFRIS